MRVAKGGLHGMRGLVATAVLLGHAPLAWAFADQVHAAMPRWMFPKATLAKALPTVSPGALPAFRQRFYARAAHLPDPVLRQAFLARYPTAASFDSAAFKAFLGLDPLASVWGLDRAPEQSQSLGAVLATAAAAPDLDARNQNRLLRDGRGRAVRLADGGLVPVDPMVLAIGRPTGVSSQAHAHYGLPPMMRSDDPAVLKADPRRFAMPPEIETYAAANAQLWTDLAVLAGRWGQPTLAVIHEGAWQHYAEDVANQVHTVQVGIYDFFYDAKVQSFLEWFRSLGGLWRAPLEFRQIGVTIVSNHHLLSEYYFMKRMDEIVAGSPRQSPAARQVLESLAEDDAAFKAQLQALPADGAWAAAMVDRLADVSSREGADLYSLTRRFAQPRLSQAGVAFTAGESDADAFVRPATDPDVAAALHAYYGLYGNAFRRAGTMTRLWQVRYREALQRPDADTAAVERIVRQQLRYWSAAEARQKVWLAGQLLLSRTATLP